MNLDLDEKEAHTLLQSLRIRYYDIKESNKDLIEWEKKRREKKPPTREEQIEKQCFCCLDMGYEPIEKIEDRCYAEEEYYRNLRDKLKKFQMTFPCAEHDPNRQYEYGKTFGYEKAKWKDRETKPLVDVVWQR